jgi:hypothetical protein
MNAVEFWATLDRIEQAFEAGTVSQGELITRATILGWEWHKEHAASLPARPPSLQQGERWYGVFRFKQAGHYEAREAIALFRTKNRAEEHCDPDGDLIVRECYL